MIQLLDRFFRTRRAGKQEREKEKTNERYPAPIQLLVSHSRGRNEIKLKLFTNEVYLSPHFNPALCTTCLSACFWRLAFSFRLPFHCPYKRYQPSLNRSPVFATRRRAILSATANCHWNLARSAMRREEAKDDNDPVDRKCVPNSSLDMSYKRIVSWSYKFVTWILRLILLCRVDNFCIVFFENWRIF